MTAALLLSGAIVLEVSGTLSLRMGAVGSRWWYAAVAVLYAGAFGLLALVLAAGMPLGIAYGVWSAVGVVLTAILGRLLFQEPFTWVGALGVALITGGVLLVLL